MLIRGGISAAKASALSELLVSLLVAPAGVASVEMPLTAPALLFHRASTVPGLKQMIAGKNRAPLHEFQMIETFHPVPADSDLLIEPDPLNMPEFGKHSFLLRDRKGLLLVRGQMGIVWISRGQRGFGAPVTLPASLEQKDLPRVSIGTITRDHLARYVALSGDHNPIHTDPDYARGFGFRDCLVPGMLLAGLCEFARPAARHNARIRLLRMRFSAPVYQGSDMEILVQKKRDGAITRMFFTTGADRLAAVADLHDFQRISAK